MTKSLITGGTALATTMAAQAAQADSAAVAELASTTFEAPEPPGPGAAFRTVHAHAVEVMRRVVKVDDAAFSELFNQGQIMPPETRVTTECMRGAIAMYDHAAELAAKAPIPAMLAQALAKVDAAMAQPADEDHAVAGQLLSEARALIELARMAFDFQDPPVDAAAAASGLTRSGLLAVAARVWLQSNTARR